MSTTVIQNGNVFAPEGCFERKDLYIKDGLIIDNPSLEDRKIVDATGLYVVPGFVDIHTHGAMGHDFCDASVDGLRKIARFEKSKGITSFLPTSMTFDEDRLMRIFDTAKEIGTKNNTNSVQHGMARILGINMEGPFISVGKKGAQNADYIMKPDVNMFRRLNDSCNNMINLITLAPEAEGAVSFIKELKDEVHISLGHSAAGYDTAQKAFDAGADHVTHLFNGMNGFHHRDTGIVGAASDFENVYVEMICDGLHISPTMIRATIKIFGEDRVVAISDSMEACGMPDGKYQLGGQKVYKMGNKATLLDGTLAGSVTSLFDCFKVLLQCHVPVETALKMVTINPAKSIGMENKVGCFVPGAFGDVLLLDKEFNLVSV